MRALLVPAVLSAALALAQPSSVRNAPLPDAGRSGEVVHRRQISHGSVVVRVRPAKPAMQRHLTLVLDFQGESILPDGAELSVAFYRPGSSERIAHHLLQPLNKFGAFGTHFTPEQAGAYRAEFRERLESSRKERVLFEVGIQVETTPQPVAEDEDTRTGPQKKMVLDVTMETLGEQWDDLMSLLKDPRARKDDAMGLARSISDLAGNVEGQVPRHQMANRKEFDGYARLLQQRVGKLVSLIPDRPRARQEMDDIENTLCLRCHTKFRFNIADDVRAWPKFEPRESKTAQEQKP